MNTLELSAYLIFDIIAMGYAFLCSFAPPTHAIGLAVISAFIGLLPIYFYDYYSLFLFSCITSYSAPMANGGIWRRLVLLTLCRRPSLKICRKILLVRENESLFSMQVIDTLFLRYSD